MEKINKVLLVAGTHGNELSGIYLQELIKNKLYQPDRTTFTTESIRSNPKAVEECQRFISHDLNRQFSNQTEVVNEKSNEHAIAEALRSQHGGNNNQLCIDLHNTTSNMGATLILLESTPFYTSMGAYIKKRIPDANILFETRKTWEEQPYLCTMTKYGVMLEVGAQTHGTLKHDTLEDMKQLLSSVLDFIELVNLNKLPELPTFEAFFYQEEVEFPTDENGMRLAVVHPTVCGKDFEAVKPGDPLLATFLGYDIHWQGEQETYPHFINEVAYSASNIAMALAEKKLVTP